jgi:CO dehydrogenase maturation factor
MKKVAVCGKGGSGKSTVVSLLAGALRDKGYRVLVLDSDESNPGLYRMLGLDKRPSPLLELVGGKKRVFEAFSDAPQSPKSVLTQEQFSTGDLPSEYVAENDGIRLLCVGKILQSLEGCACPMGALSREFLKRIALDEDEVILVDTEAGTEHFGRGVESHVDTVLIVTEPSFDSLELTEKIARLARQIGVRDTWAILNKVPSELAARLSAELTHRGVAVLGSVAYDAQLFQAGLEGRPVRADRAKGDVAAILERLLQGGNDVLGNGVR